MNRLVIALCALATIVVAAPVEEVRPIAIVRQNLDGPNPEGSYSYNFETENGIQVQEDGHLNHLSEDEAAMEARGSYSYTDNEGNTYQVTYLANENGFQPEGAHLPTPPPVPELIQRALQYISEHPEEDDESTAHHHRRTDVRSKNV